MALSPQMADLSLGSRIRLARQNAGLRIGELARSAGVSRDSLSDYEVDRTDPPAKVLRAIAEATNVSADWLLFGTTRVNLDGVRSTLRVLPGSRPADEGVVVPFRPFRHVQPVPSGD